MSVRSRLPASFTAAWDRASKRERRIAIAGAFVVLVAAGWALVWQPLTADIERAREELVRNRDALAHARGLVDESAALGREPASKAGGDPAAAIARVLVERDLRPAGRPEIRDNRVKVVLPDARFDRIVLALETLRKDDGLRAVEATIIARVEPGTVRAELTFAR